MYIFCLLWTTVWFSLFCFVGGGFRRLQSTLFSKTKKLKDWVFCKRKERESERERERLIDTLID